jgi:molybdate transport system substrate-binding protein
MKWLAFLLMITSCLKNNKETLRFAVASNMQTAAQELSDTFSAETKINCEIIVGSSGKLTAQILAGAPYDIFLAANMNYPQAVFDGGKAEFKPQKYAYGKLVLWTTFDEIQPSLEGLAKDNIKSIAISNPRLAPYGFAGKEVLENLNIYNQIIDKLVYAESISQTNQFIYSGAAQIGFTSKSSVIIKGVKGTWIEINDSLYTPLKQGFVIIKQSKEKLVLANTFQKFLQGETASKILISNGFSINE